MAFELVPVCATNILYFCLEMEDSTTPQAEHSSPIPVAKQPELKKRVRTDPRDVYQRTKDMKQELLDKVEEISVFLPNNTLDELIDCLGGPNQVIIHIFTPHHFSYWNGFREFTTSV